MVTGKNGLRDILFTHDNGFEKTGGFRRYARRFLAGGLVVQEGGAHRMRRKIVGPISSMQNVYRIESMMNGNPRALVQELRELCEQ